MQRADDFQRRNLDWTLTTIETIIAIIMLFLSSELLGGMWPCSLCNFFVVLPLLSCGLRRRSMASVAVWRFFGVELGSGLPRFMLALSSSFSSSLDTVASFSPSLDTLPSFSSFHVLAAVMADTSSRSSDDEGKLECGQSVTSSSELKNRDCKRAIALMCISLVARTRVHCRERILCILSFSPAVLDAVV